MLFKINEIDKYILIIHPDLCNFNPEKIKN